MNSDDFEKQLQRQPLRQIPGDWREEILRTAQARVPAVDSHRPAPWLRAGLTLWRELLRPYRHTWMGLATAWIVLLAINARLSDGSNAPVTFATGTAAGRIQLFEEQRRVLAELTGPIEPTPAEPPHRIHPQPRSQRATVVRAG